MLASNLIYATLPNMYPRLLADDGVHEPLVLPPDIDTEQAFMFYNERGEQVNGNILSAEYISPSGTTVSLPVLIPPFSISFPATLEAGGVVLIRLANNTACYPFRLLRAGG